MRTRTSALLLTAALLSSLLVALPSAAATPTTFVVTKTTDTNDGTCDADCSLREAIAAANANRTSPTEPQLDIIVLQAGQTYTLTLTGAGEDGNATGDLDITDDVIIRTDTPGSTATIDATGLQADGGTAANADGDRVLDVFGTTSVGLIDIVVTGGDVDGDGGGIRLNGGGADVPVLELHGGEVSGNAASGDGGGIAADYNSVVTAVGTTFAEDQATNGGAFAGDYANATFTDTTFTMNVASSDGGAIENDSGNVEVWSSTLSDNDAGSGGGAYQGSYANATFTDSELTGNSADWGGASSNYEGNVRFERTVLDGNTASFYGGTLYSNYGADVLVDSPITNSGLTGTGSLYGGAIYVSCCSAVSLIRSPISDTTNTTTGGGIYGGAIALDTEGELQLVDSPITNTTNTATSDVYGGAIYLYESGFSEQGDNSITNTTTTTSSTVYGGVVYLQYTGGAWMGDQFTGTEVTTTSSVYGGVFYLYEASLEVDGITVEDTMIDTTSTVEGGVINQDDYGGVTIRNSTFRNTTAGTGGNSGYGGVYYGDYGPVVIEDSLFESNTTTYTGGAVSWYEAGVVVRRSVFRDNHVINPLDPTDDTYGGAFGADDYGSLQIEDSVIEGNSATYIGGGIYAYDAPVIIRGSQLTDNMVVGEVGEGGSGYGGAIYLDSSSPLILERSTLSGNGVEVDGDAQGGGIYAYDGAVTVRDTTFAGNTATSRTGTASGGAIYFYDDYEPARIDRSLFVENSAVGDVDGFGGGLYVDQTNVVVQNSTFSANHADSDGGAAYVTGQGSLRAVHVTGIANSGGSASGGFVYNDGSTVVLKGSLLQDHTPDTCAGDPVTSQGHNQIDDDSCALAGQGQAGDQEDLDVAYEPLADNGGHTMTHALPAGSAAIDAAGQCTTVSGVLPLTTDQRGAGRPIDGDGDAAADCDVGAFEYASGVTVVATDPAASEDGPDTGTFTFTRQGTDGDLTVTYAIGGTATNGTDYATISGQVVIPDGQASATVTVTPAADDQAEGPETVVVTILPDPSYAVGVPDTATVTIADRADAVTRLAGTDRIGTAIAISQDSFGDGEADAVVLARSDEFPDALAGTPFAVDRNGPILLTPPSGLLPAVAAEIQRVLPAGRTVYLLGGPAALSDAVANAVSALGYSVVRIAGADRYQTAIAIAQALGNPTQILIASGANFPDALGAGAAAAHIGGSVLLTPPAAHHPAVDSYLNALSGETLTAVGGPAAAAYPGATPIVGTDRFHTARLVAQQFFTSPNAAGLARGDVFADALSGGPHIAGYGGPMLLTPSDSLHAQTAAYFCANAAALQQVFAYGGTTALQPGVLATALARISGIGC